MGLFHKHKNHIVEHFDEVFARGTQESEPQFLTDLNQIDNEVALDKSYSTNEKLKISELLQQIRNCSASERQKYAKKVRRALK